MILDELVSSIPNSEIELKNQLTSFVYDWKMNNSSIEDLVYLIEKWNGNVWFKSENKQNDFYKNWIKFKTQIIDSISGMTVNERLYCFGLFDIWDKSNSESKRIIRIKLKVE